MYMKSVCKSFSRQILENENLISCFSLAFVCKKMPHCLKYSSTRFLSTDGFSLNMLFIACKVLSEHKV